MDLPPYEDRDHRVAFDVSDDAYQALRMAAVRNRVSTTQYMSDVMEDHAKSISASVRESSTVTA